MTDSRTPRFALWVLRRLGVDNEWLAGDLLEEYSGSDARTCGCGAKSSARLSRGPNRVRDTGPLNVAGPRVVRSARPSTSLERPRIDLSGGPVPGIGGLTVVALVFQTAVVSPQLLWLPVVGLAAGSLVGVALVVRRRREPYRMTTSPSSAVLPGLRRTRETSRRAVSVAALLLLGSTGSWAQVPASTRPAVPVEPVVALLDAFESHDVVALGDPHGNERAHAFRLSLIRDDRFVSAVDDIVVEWGNARYQDLNRVPDAVATDYQSVASCPPEPGTNVSPRSGLVLAGVF